MRNVKNLGAFLFWIGDCVSRINIEDSIYRDERFHRLSAFEGKYKALGLCVAAWDLAHKWYLKHPENLIPLSEWSKDSELSLLEKYGLAERKDNGIYVKGTNKECEYLTKRSEAGKKGALISNGKRYSKPQQAQQISPSSSSSSSISDSTSKNNMCDSVESHVSKFPLDEIYKAYPKRQGSSNKGKGLAKLKRLITSQDDFDDAMNAVMCYNKHCTDTKKVKTELVKMFSTFFDPHGDWREWINYKADKQKSSMDQWLEKYKNEA